MSSISSVSSSNFSLSQITKVASHQVGSTSDADAPPPPRAGGLFDAIAKTLAQLGITATSTDSSGTSSSSSASASTDTTTTDAASAETSAAQALGSFIQSLLAALHSQNGAQDADDASTTDGATDNIQATSGRRPPPPPGGGHGPGGPGGAGKLESDLQSLIAELTSATASSDSTTTDTTSSTSSTEATSSDSTSLENSFKNLLSALGESSSTAKLSQFLSALATNLQNGAPVGNVVNTQA